MLEQDIQKLSGIGEQRAKLFYKKDIHTIKDLLYFFPRDYEDRSVIKEIHECTDGETVCIRAVVFSAVREARIRKNLTISSMTVFDDSDSLVIKWYNNRYVKRNFSAGEVYIFYGKIHCVGRKKEMENPIYESENKRHYTGKIIPIYPLSESLTQKMVQSAMEQAIQYVTELKDCLPPSLREKYQMVELEYAIKNIHFPSTLECYQMARKRLIFEELFLFQLGLLLQKEGTITDYGDSFETALDIDQFQKLLPFPFTNAQRRVLAEISKDLCVKKPMNRLLQGDVGSGKTAVAAATVYATVKNGYQAAIMAPTEILARQHMETFLNYFSKQGFRIVLLTGNMKASEKREVCEQIQCGHADIIIGTHAIIQQNIEYHRLGLVVVDEQHRFGVKQRTILTEKGNSPNVLVMSATPIPRTLALVLYGDLDISVIDELPPGHKPIKTYAIPNRLRQRAYGFMENNIRSGRQAYIVCPLIEETESLDLKNAVTLYENLQKTYPSISFGLIHGKMKAAEKESIMSRFVNGEISALVSTTVIEVGINVPNSTVMIVENAERFGLNQLHQLRGRVGRGAQQSFCIFIIGGSGALVKKRMETMCSSNDGFYIAEQDLLLRGPGDFFGTRQHGLPTMKIANLFTDSDMLKMAQAAAQEICVKDPKLEKPENLFLKQEIDEKFNKKIFLN